MEVGAGETSSMPGAHVFPEERKAVHRQSFLVRESGVGMGGGGRGAGLGGTTQNQFSFLLCSLWEDRLSSPLTG